MNPDPNKTGPKINSLPEFQTVSFNQNIGNEEANTNHQIHSDVTSIRDIQNSHQTDILAPTTDDNYTGPGYNTPGQSDPKLPLLSSNDSHSDISNLNRDLVVGKNMNYQTNNNSNNGKNNTKYKQAEYSMDAQFSDNRSSHECCICPSRLCCKSGRECLCFLIGIILSIIGIGCFGYVYLQETTGSGSNDHATIPSKTNFSNYSNGPSYIYTTWKSAQKNGATISKYKLQARETPETGVNYEVNTTFEDIYSGTNLHYNHTGLHGDSSYDYRICACNSIGCANYSNIFTIVTLAATVAPAPDAPYIIDVTEITNDTNNTNDDILNDDSILLETINLNSVSENNDNNKNLVTIGFTSSNGDGGSQIHYFEVYYAMVLSNSNETSFKLFCNTSSIPNYNTYNIHNKYNCTNYSKIESSDIIEYKVRSNNEQGFSLFSKSTPCIIPTNAMNYYMCSIPEVPSKINIFTELKYYTQPYTIILEWTEPYSDSPILGYQLLRNNWWNHTGLYNQSLNDNGLSKLIEIDGLLPGVPYNFKLRSYNVYGFSDWSDELSIYTNDTGACGNLNDLTNQKYYYNSMQSTITQCFAKCLTSSDRDTCSQECIEDNLGFSADCALCWVDDGNCSFKNCATSCLNLNSEKCYECSKEKCFPDVETCSGLPMWTFPQ